MGAGHTTRLLFGKQVPLRPSRLVPVPWFIAWLIDMDSGTRGAVPIGPGGQPQPLLISRIRGPCLPGMKRLPSIPGSRYPGSLSTTDLGILHGSMHVIASRCPLAFRALGFLH